MKSILALFVVCVLAVDCHKRHKPYKHQGEPFRQEINRKAEQEAQRVIESLDDLSSMVQQISSVSNLGLSYRSNDVADKPLEKPKPFLLNILKHVFENLHRVSSRTQDDAPKFSTKFNSSIYECTKNEQVSQAMEFSSVYLPKEVMIFADPTNERSVVMETHGLVTDEELSIYSVVRSKLTDLDVLLPTMKLLEDPLISLPKELIGRQQEQSSQSVSRPPLLVTVGEAVGDYMFRTIHALLSRMIDNMNDGHAVSALLKCEMDSVECLVDQRYDPTGLRMCTSTLCKCMNEYLPEIGANLRPTPPPKVNAPRGFYF